MLIDNLDEVSDFLAQSGVKGMKWGVRRADKKYESKTGAFPALGVPVTNRTAAKIFSAAKPGVDRDMIKLNERPKMLDAWHNGDLVRDTPARTEYVNNVRSILEKHLQKAADGLGPNASGTRKYKVVVGNDGLGWLLTTTEVQHEDGVLMLIPEMDEKGFIHSFSIGEPNIAQSDLNELDDFLAHFGVKGMKWGVRKADRGHGLTSFMIKNGATKDDAGRLSRTFARVAGTARLGVAGVNARYKGLDLTKDAAARAKYESEIKGVMQRGVKQAFKNTALSAGVAASIITLNPAPGTAVAAGIGGANFGVRVYRSVKNIQEYVRTRGGEVLAHADGAEYIVPIIFTRDKFGLITDIRFEGVDEDFPLEQSDLDNLDDFLAHHGVKGMKWGVRRSINQLRTTGDNLRAKQDAHREEKTKKVIAKSNAKIERQKQLTARANAKEAAAKAKTETADAKAAAAKAKLEIKIAKDQARFAKKEALLRKDDPANGLIKDAEGNVRDPNGISGATNLQAIKTRNDAARNARTLDDATLKEYTQRLNTEKQLKQAIREDTAPKRSAARKLINDAGKDVAKTALVGIGSLAVYAALNKYGGAGLGNLGTKKGSAEALDDFLGKIGRRKIPKSKLPPVWKPVTTNIPTGGTTF